MRQVIFLIKNSETLKSEDYEELLRRYEEAKIKIHLFQDLNDAIQIYNYDNFLEYFSLDNFRDFDIVCDDLLFLISWYRLYHHDFNNFLCLYVDGNYSINWDKYNNIEKHFFKSIQNFNGIINENLKKNLYINLNESNYEQICKIALKSSFYFANIWLYGFEKETEYNIEKIYLLNEYSISSTNENNNLKKEKINLNNKELNFNTERADIEFVYPYILLYAIKNLKQEETFSIINAIKTFNFNEKKFNQSLLSLNISNYEKSVLLLLYCLESSNNYLTHKLYELLETEDIPIEKKYFFIMQLSVYQYRNKTLNRDEYYIYQKKIMNQITNYYQNKLDNISLLENESKKKKIIILVDQFLMTLHAPTMVIYTISEFLLENTEYDIVMIIEENMIPSPEEILPIPYFSGNSSMVFKKYHQSLYNQKRVQIVYSDSKHSKYARISQSYKEIIEHRPEIVLSFASYSILQNLLYQKFPIIYISCGQEYSISDADYYLYKNVKRALEIEPNIEEKARIKEFNYITDLMPKTKDYSRSYLDFQEDDFIILTVGNRISDEIDAALIDEVGPLLRDNSKVKWMLVGDVVPPYIIEHYADLIGNQIKHIPYETDLVALTEICDVFLNPNRIGGGYSVAVAMYVKVPVIMTAFESDGLIILGRENAIGKSYKDLIIEINTMIINPNYKKEIGEIQYSSLVRYSTENSNHRLLKYIDELLKGKREQ